VKAPTSAERSEWAEQLGDQDLHRGLVADLPCLNEVTQREPGAPSRPLTGWVRVVAWNILRGRRRPELASLLRSSGAAISLLSEVDSGMARTSNADVTAELADALGVHAAYGVEFVELGLGDETERQRLAADDASNAHGLHGNAVLSAARLTDPAVLRLSDGGPLWFAAGSTQPRVGGRMAVLATVDIDETPVRVASLHLENRAGPAERAAQMETLLRAIDERAGDGPAVVGGDCNTLGAPLEELLDRALVARLRAGEPTRFTWPVAHEPLFTVAADHGFDWVQANVAAPTTSHDALGLPDHVPIRLDWIFVRGLEARRPAVVGARGLSDHDLVSVAVRLPRVPRAS
jgi:endonuclease/exonuclease/phosphatase family metal-dependent hydrolase